MADHKQRLRIASCKLETTSGTYEPMLAADAALKIYYAQSNFEATSEEYEREIASATFSREPALKGITRGVVTVQAEVRGSGGTGAVTDLPSWDPWIQACGMTNIDCYYSADVTISAQDLATIRAGMEFESGPDKFKVIAIDTTSVSGDQFKANLVAWESAGTIDTKDGAFTRVGGGETITLTVTTGAFAAYGRGYKFDSGSTSTYSAALWHPYGDGTNSTVHEIRGATGAVSFTANGVGEPMLMNFTITGSLEGENDRTTLTAIPYEEVIPPLFNGVDFRTQVASATGTGTYQYSNADTTANYQEGNEICINNWSLEVANDVVDDECATATGGVKGTAITGRTVSGSHNPRLLEKAVHSYFDDWDEYRNGSHKLTVGDTPGNIVDFFVPNVLYSQYSLGESNGFTTSVLPFGAFTPWATEGDNELFIVSR